MDKALESMVDNAFSYAGQHGVKLSRLLRDNLNDREKNGEQITMSEITYGITKMEESYNTILEIASQTGNPANVIASAMKTVETQLAGVGSMDTIERVAERAALDAAEQEEIREDNFNITDTVDEAAAIIATAETIENTPEEKVENLYKSQTIEKINRSYQTASQGDIDSIAKVNEIERITDLSVKNEELDDKSKRGLLARMMRISTLEDEESTQVLEELADKYGIDIFKVDESGNRTVDYSKLEKEYHDAVEPVNPKAAEMTREDFGKLVAVAAKREADRGTYNDNDRTLQKAVGDKARERELVEYERKMTRALKENDTDTVNQLVEMDPEKAKSMVKNLLLWQENPKLSREKQTMLQQQAMDISSVLRERTIEQERKLETNVEQANEVAESNSPKNNFRDSSDDFVR